MGGRSGQGRNKPKNNTPPPANNPAPEPPNDSQTPVPPKLPPAPPPEPQGFDDVKFEFTKAELQADYIKEVGNKALAEMVGVKKDFKGTVKVIGYKSYLTVFFTSATKAELDKARENGNPLTKELTASVEIYPATRTARIATSRLRGQKEGTSKELFTRQVEGMQKLGIKRIDVKATGSKKSGNDGYYEMMEFGVKPTRRQSKLIADKYNIYKSDKQPKLRKGEDLMKSEAGRKWWKENGFAFDGTFDPSKNSQQYKNLKRK